MILKIVPPWDIESAYGEYLLISLQVGSNDYIKKPFSRAEVGPCAVESR